MSPVLLKWVLSWLGAVALKYAMHSRREAVAEEDEPLRRIAINVDDGPHGVLHNAPQLLPELHPDGPALVQIGVARGGGDPPSPSSCGAFPFGATTAGYKAEPRPTRVGLGLSRGS